MLNPSFIRGFTFSIRLNQSMREGSHWKQHDQSLLHLSSSRSSVLPSLETPGNESVRSRVSPSPTAASLLSPAAVAAASAPALLFVASAGFLHHVGRRLRVGHGVRVAGVAAKSHRVRYDGGDVVWRADLRPGDDHLAVGVIDRYVDGGHDVGWS